MEREGPDRYFMTAGGNTVQIDGEPYAGDTPYRFMNDPAAIDRAAAWAVSQESDTYLWPWSFARESRNHGGDLDFKPELNARYGARTLWNAGNGMYVHTDKVGNAAWGHYTSRLGLYTEDFAVSQATKAARSTNPSMVGESLDAQFIRRGWHIGHGHR